MLWWEQGISTLLLDFYTLSASFSPTIKAISCVNLWDFYEKITYHKGILQFLKY